MLKTHAGRRDEDHLRGFRRVVSASGWTPGRAERVLPVSEIKWSMRQTVQGAGGGANLGGTADIVRPFKGRAFFCAGVANSAPDQDASGLETELTAARRPRTHDASTGCTGTETGGRQGTGHVARTASARILDADIFQKSERRARAAGVGVLRRSADGQRSAAPRARADARDSRMSIRATAP